MELHQLRYALAVADAGSFTAAASTLHVSQSGVSAQVGRLEHELGVRLFERSARRVTITPAGADLLDRMRNTLAALDDVRSVADEVLGLLRGSVRLGSVAGLGWPAFLDAIEQVHNAHPQLKLSLREGNSATLQSDVLNGRLDGFSTDRLFHLLNKLGCDIQVRVSRPRENSRRLSANGGLTTRRSTGGSWFRDGPPSSTCS